RADLLDLSSRPAGAGVAVLLLLALVLVVARGGAVAADPGPGRGLPLRLAQRREPRRRHDRGLWDRRRRAVRPHGLRDGDDLCLAEADPRLAQPLGGAELPVA